MIEIPNPTMYVWLIFEFVLILYDYFRHKIIVPFDIGNCKKYDRTLCYILHFVVLLSVIVKDENAMIGTGLGS